MKADAQARAPLRLGFAGLGWIGLHRMKALIDSGEAEAAILCDPSQDAIARAENCAPGAHVVHCFEELLIGELDGLVIATPSAQHAAQAIAALNAGVPVFCQKPLGRTSTEARAAVDAAVRADRLLGVDFSYRFTQAAQAIRSLIRAGELGEIFACDLNFHNAYGPDKPWFHDVAQSGGGCVMDLGVHLIDLALWMLPDARVIDVDAELFRRGERLARPPLCVEDYSMAHLRLTTGAVVRIACSWNLHAGRDAVIGAAFHGTRGGACMRNIHGSFYDFAAEKFTGTQTHILCDSPDAWGGRAALEWARRLESSPEFDPEARNFVRVAKVVDAVYGRPAAY